MDKEEAMEILKGFHDESATFSVRTALETLHPELAEPKDEKTRKRIIALVNAHGQGMYKDEMLAWLENIPYTIDHEKREGFHLGYKAGLEKQGEKSLTVDIDSMVEAYEQRLISQGNGVRNSPIVNMCVAAFKHGVENTLDELHLKQGDSPIKWNKNTEGNKPQVNHSVLMKTFQGIAEGEWKGEYWLQYRWAGIVRDSDVLSWIELSDLDKQGEQKQKQYDIDVLEKHITKDSISELAHTVIVRNGWEIVDAKEQKSAWSEKDREMIDETLYFIREYQQSNRCKDENGMQNSVTCEKWLKSLKERMGGEQ